MLEWHEEVPVPELIQSRRQLGVPPELPVVLAGEVLASFEMADQLDGERQQRLYCFYRC